MHAFGRMPNNADAVYVISIGLVSNGVAMFVLLYLMFHVVCVYRSGWHSLGFPGLPMLKVPPPLRVHYITERFRSLAFIVFAYVCES